MEGPRDFQDLCEDLWKTVEPVVMGMGQRDEDFEKRKERLRRIFDGIMYKLRTGCQWSMMPRTYGAKSCVHEHFQRWASMGVFDELLKKSSELYDDKVGFKWGWQVQDGTLVQAPTRKKKNRLVVRGLGQTQRIGDVQAARSICT